MKKYFIVWNAGKSEGFITDDANDARSAVSGKPHRAAGYSTQSSAGAAFHEAYEDDKLTIQKVEL